MTAKQGPALPAGAVLEKRVNMKYNKIDLKVPYEKAGLSGEGCNPVLVEYIADQSEEIGRNNRPAVLIIPGGGYDYVSDREGEPIAFALLTKGIQCYVLKYSCVKKSFPLDLLEAATALAYIREHAVENDINPDDITVMGFSAGGHLAASLAVHWDKNFVKEPLGFFKEEHRPNALALAYPVIATTDTHQGSIDNLMCEDSYLPLGGLESTFGVGYLTKEDREKLISLDKQVSDNTPKTFIWHCADDGCVPVSNSLRFAAALNEHHIPFAMHIYQNGGHGLALADEVTAKEECQINVDAAGWIKLVCDWIYRK